MLAFKNTTLAVPGVAARAEATLKRQRSSGDRKCLNYMYRNVTWELHRTVPEHPGRDRLAPVSLTADIDHAGTFELRRHTVAFIF